MDYDEISDNSVRDMDIPVFHAVRDNLEKGLENARGAKADAAHRRNVAQNAYDDACHQLQRLEAAYAALTGLQTDEPIDINNPLNVPVDRRYGIPVDGGAIKRG